MTLCDLCRPKHDAWLDYRLPRQPKIASGASRDDTLAGVKDAWTGRFEQWRKTIRDQQALIARLCEEQHQ
ncbi:hypothetical protein [Mycolicibacterium peregrinum]|uniref:hypothetical protein n=1 Tax=Mycolicibacterium peregrinum TaxID=43304 RepID=UPI003AAA5000